MTLALDFLQAHPIAIQRGAENLVFTQVGCGGTGGWLCQHLARLIGIINEQYTNKISYTLVDPDIIEEQNLTRQNFCAAEVGMYKAEALAMRYGLAYGVNITAITQKFSPEHIYNGYSTCNIIIGCVDNPAARQLMASLLADNNRYSPPTFWLDCGNYAQGGQVLLGTTTDRETLRAAFKLDNNYCLAVPSPALQHPELLEPSPQNEAALSCLELAIRSTQSLAINQQIAALATNYIIKLLMGKLKTFASYVNLEAGTMTSRYATPAEFSKVLGEPDFFTPVSKAGTAEPTTPAVPEPTQLTEVGVVNNATE